MAETHRWFYLRVRAVDLFASLMILECKLYNSTTCLPHKYGGTLLSALHKERTYRLFLHTIPMSRASYREIVISKYYFAVLQFDLIRELNPDLPTAKLLLNHNTTVPVCPVKIHELNFVLFYFSSSQRHLGCSVNALLTIKRIWTQHKKCNATNNSTQTFKL